MKAALITVLGEIRKSLLISWTYRANTFASLLTVGFIFVAIGFLMGGGELDPGQLTSMFIGYLTWFYALAAISDLAWGIRGETTAGTLEQMAMSPVPVSLVLVGRVLANLILSTIQILLMGASFFLLLGIRIPMRWQGLLVLAMTLVGVYGFGFIVAGATLIFKQVESFANLMQNVLVFLNGTLLPVHNMPGWLANIARLLPSTQGIVVLRRILLDGQSLASVWRDGSLLWLIAHSALFLAAGWLVFGMCERVAKEQGSLGQY